MKKQNSCLAKKCVKPKKNCSKCEFNSKNDVKLKLDIDSIIKEIESKYSKKNKL